MRLALLRTQELTETEGAMPQSTNRSQKAAGSAARGQSASLSGPISYVDISRLLFYYLPYIDGQRDGLGLLNVDEGMGCAILDAYWTKRMRCVIDFEFWPLMMNHRHYNFYGSCWTLRVLTLS